MALTDWLSDNMGAAASKVLDVAAPVVGVAAGGPIGGIVGTAIAGVLGSGSSGGSSSPPPPVQVTANPITGFDIFQGGSTPQVSIPSYPSGGSDVVPIGQVVSDSTDNLVEAIRRVGGLLGISPKKMLDVLDDLRLIMDNIAEVRKYDSWSDQLDKLGLSR